MQMFEVKIFYKANTLVMKLIAKDLNDAKKIYQDYIHKDDVAEIENGNLKVRIENHELKSGLISMESTINFH